jgi:hypothetical protein
MVSRQHPSQQAHEPSRGYDTERPITRNHEEPHKPTALKRRRNRSSASSPYLGQVRVPLKERAPVARDLLLRLFAVEGVTVVGAGAVAG